MDDPRATALIKRYRTLQTQRQHWESHWQAVADYTCPRKGDVTKRRSGGDKRTELIFDGTAIHAAELMSASLHGMLTNPSTPWFDLRYEDAKLNGVDAAKEWLESATDVMYQFIGRSNFAEQVHELYSDLVVFGTGVIFVDADVGNAGVRFSTRHIAECYVSENEQGCDKATVVHKPRLLSDNGSSYIAGELADWLDERNMRHIRGAPYHPQTQGKIERWHQTLKNRILLENYYLPGDLEAQVEAFVAHYNHQRYHESLNNLTPADVYFGRGQTILLEREKIKRPTIEHRRLQHRKYAA